jgi:formylglycine-generating enzyme required for sulfatase activity
MKKTIIVLAALVVFGSRLSIPAEPKIVAGVGIFNDEKKFTEIIPRLRSQEINRLANGNWSQFYAFEAQMFLEIAMKRYTEETARGETAMVKALGIVRANLDSLPADLPFGRVVVILISDGMENVIPEKNREESMRETGRRLRLPLANGAIPELVVFLFKGDSPVSETKRDTGIRSLKDHIAGEDHVFNHQDLYDASSRARLFFDDMITDALLKDENIAIYWLLDRSASTKSSETTGTVQNALRAMGNIITEALDRLVEARKPNVYGDTILVKKGEPMIGSDEVPNALPPGRVVIKQFRMARTELTRWEYYFTARKYLDLEEPDSATKDLPMTGLNSFQAKEFCNWLGKTFGNWEPYYEIYRDEAGAIVDVKPNPGVKGPTVRLPRQTEIEYTQSLSWPPEPDAINLSGQLVDVMSLAPDALGFYGLYTNALEITDSILENDDTSRRMVILKGGSCSDGDVFPPAFRWWEPPDFFDTDLGFRYCIDNLLEEQ